MPRYSIDDWTAVKERLRLGDSIRECAKSTGVDRGAVLKWSHMDRPPDRMVLTMDIPDNPIPCARTSPKQRLTYEDRCFIAALLDVGRTKQEIAARMGISRTTVARELRRTLTWDQGSEMACVEKFKLASGFEVYFCDPHSPWQRPTNENMNGLIREFFPKKTDFTKVSDEEVDKAQWQLNNRPRKVLDWKFPSEAMQEVLAEGAMIV